MSNTNSSKSLLETSENRAISDMDLDNIARYVIGTQQRFRENIIIPRTVGPVQLKTNEQKLVESAMESCIFKSIASCVIGIFILRCKISIIYIGIIKRKLDFQGMV